LRFDVVVLGGGPAGYVAAVTALQRGLRVALVERKYLGGECSNWGCIPSKALIELGNAVSLAKSLGKYGVSLSISAIDKSKVLKHVSRAVIKAREGVKYLLSDAVVIQGVGKLKDPHTIKVEGQVNTELEATNIIVATGTEPKTVPTFSFDGERIIHNRHFFELDSLPNSMLIVGAGAIGCEISEALAQLGVEVHLLEIMDKILPEEAKKALEAVSEAVSTATDMIRDGVKSSEPDSVARGVLRRYGLENYFIHSLGHGVGLEVHEKPRLAQGIDETLVEGMVVTVEPGVYIHNKFGIRLENLVVVRKNKAETLNKLPLITSA
jgi:dihydrolipoamide dehydrogenase